MNISDLHKRINDWLVSQTQPYYIEIEVGPVTLEYGILKTYNDILRGSYLIARNLDRASNAGSARDPDVDTELMMAEVQKRKSPQWRMARQLCR